MNPNRVFLQTRFSAHSRLTENTQQRIIPSLLPRPRLAGMVKGGGRLRRFGTPVLVLGLICGMAPIAMSSHRGSEEHHVTSENPTEEMVGHSISGASFQIFVDEEKATATEASSSQVETKAALHTVIQAFNHMMEHRTEYKRFHEALTKGALHKVVIEPKVVNREGKEFLFLVARTSRPNQVKLLISASELEAKGYVNHPDQLVPVLAREFQWVVSKSDTTSKRQTKEVPINLDQAPVKTNQEIEELSGEERERLLQELFRTYLTTTDRHNSLEGQSYYETGTTTRIPPAQPDSTTKLYDIRVREALQKIVHEPYFQEHTPKAVRSLLNGKIWNVAFADIPSRDWATRTRVVSKDQSITLGEKEKTIQPAMVLINIHRSAAPEDPFYTETNGLPMGALPADILARVIGREIQDNITEKSMRGHTAQDEITSPR